jgi:hypothetical protein
MGDGYVLAWVQACGNGAYTKCSTGVDKEAYRYYYMDPRARPPEKWATFVYHLHDFRVLRFLALGLTLWAWIFAFFFNNFLAWAAVFTLLVALSELLLARREPP